MCHCIFFRINPRVSKHHAFRLHRTTSLTISFWGGILKLLDLDSLTIFIGGGGILKLSDLDSLTIFILGSILKLSDLDSLTIFIGGGYSETQNRGILEEFEPKFQPLQQAHASQIVSHILRMCRLIN